MEPIIILQGTALTDFLDLMTMVHNQNGLIYSLRFSIDDGGLKVKLNQQAWTPPLGRVDIMSGIGADYTDASGYWHSNGCSLTHAHTREVCGNRDCRET